MNDRSELIGSLRIVFLTLYCVCLSYIVLFDEPSYDLFIVLVTTLLACIATKVRVRTLAIITAFAVIGMIASDSLLGRYSGDPSGWLPFMQKRLSESWP